MKTQGAIISAIIFIIGIALALPNEANIGVMVLEALMKVPESNIDLGGMIFSIKLLGWFLIIGDIINIIFQAKKGNW